MRFSRTLTIPPHIIELATNPWWFVAYIWTFAVIAGIWYNHQRLFMHFFWPETLTIILNFALLAMIGLLVYFVQVFVHYHDAFDRVWAFLAYFMVFGLGFMILGTLYLHGTRRRWDALTGEDRYTGLRQAARGIVGGAFIVVGVAVSALRPAKSMDDLLPLAIFVLAGLVGSRFVLRALKSRITGAQI